MARKWWKHMGKYEKKDNYYEIEYDATPMPGVGKFVLRTENIMAPEKDRVRELFDRMRDIGRSSRSLRYGNSKFYDRRVRQENSKVFYKQGMFMKDFEDDFEEAVPYSEYFPYYQLMGYRQLRTYFTWRTEVRKGRVEETSLSYAYLYMYELLSNIGVANPQEGLDRLVDFWKAFRIFDSSIDKYVLRWLKDYHIYYDLPQTFPEFVVQNGLEDRYPDLAGSEDRFTLYCSLSRYDIRKSGFYADDRETLIRDCFSFTVDRLEQVFAEHGVELESFVFVPVKSMALWTPFQDALFYPWYDQRDRRVVFSAKEVYVCSRNQWTYQTALTAESGRQLVGYVLKQMEAVLRQAVGYKYKLTAGIGSVPSATLKRLEDAGIDLGQSVTEAVTAFYREATRTVVTVDRDALARIRQEALLTQERLLVPEEEEGVFPPAAQTSPITRIPPSAVAWEQQSESLSKVNILGETEPLPAALRQEETNPLPAALEKEEASPWSALREAFTQTEREALTLVLGGDADIRQFADAHGIMLEVLADGINEKAFDLVGDSLLDDDFAIYEDYLEQLKEMLGQ